MKDIAMLIVWGISMMILAYAIYESDDN